MTNNQTPPMARIAGLILAGGRGVRMGGRDKALVQFEGQPLVSICRAHFPDALAEVWIARQQDQADLSEYGHVLHDEHPDLGPLGGVLAGFAAARDMGVEYLITLPVDAPIVPYDWVAQLWSVRAPHAILRTGSDFHPTIALYDLADWKRAKQAFDAGDRSLRGWLQQAGCGIADVPENQVRNLNHLTDGDVQGV